MCIVRKTKGRRRCVLLFREWMYGKMYYIILVKESTEIHCTSSLVLPSNLSTEDRSYLLSSMIIILWSVFSYIYGILPIYWNSKT